MPDPVARPSDPGPRLVRAKRRPLIAKANRRFTDDEQLSLHCGDRPGIGPKRVGIHIFSELLDAGDGVEDVVKRLPRIFKRQGSLLARPAPAQYP